MEGGCAAAALDWPQAFDIVSSKIPKRELRFRTPYSKVATEWALLATQPMSTLFSPTYFQKYSREIVRSMS